MIKIGSDLPERLRQYAKDWRDRAASEKVVLEAADEIDALRRALYELLHVSFPASGDDVSELQDAHKKWVWHGCALLGIDPDTGSVRG